MFVVLYICIVVFSVVQSAAAKLYNRHSDNSVIFNFIKAICALVLFGIMNIAGLDVHVPTIIYGVLYGVSLSVSMYAGYKALCIGPMSLTSLIVSFSIIIPLIFGVSFCGEKITWLKGLGFAFLVLAIVFVNLNKPKAEGKGEFNYLKWTIYVMLTFFANGICSMLQKMHQMEYPGMHVSEFMFFAMLLCSVVFLFIALSKVKIKEFMVSGGKWYGCLSGAANAIANYCTLALAGFENASVLYPTISAGTILTTLLCGVMVFKEKLKYNHYLALAAGVVALVLLKI